MSSAVHEAVTTTWTTAESPPYVAGGHAHVVLAAALMHSLPPLALPPDPPQADGRVCCRMLTLHAVLRLTQAALKAHVGGGEDQDSKAASEARAKVEPHPFPYCNRQSAYLPSTTQPLS
jgi:hypothetical protein